MNIRCRLFRILKHETRETGNVKRESKNYSYKEQMAARELEKELAAKQNKSDTPQLTKKQQEMLQQQLDQEQVIRDSVRKVSDRSSLLFFFHFTLSLQIDEDARNLFDLLRQIIRMTEEQFIPFIGELLQHIWPTLKSPLTFPYARDLYLSLVSVVFMQEKNSFGKFYRLMRNNGTHRWCLTR